MGGEVMPHGAALRATAGLGGVFLLVFVAYMTIQVYARRLYPASAGPDQLALLYGVFTVASFLAPAAVNRWGARLCLFLGILGYGSLVAGGLLYFLRPSAAVLALVMVCAALNGGGAALLWTAQGKIIMSYSTDENRGLLFGLFWAMFNSASIVGGLLAFFYFSVSASQGSGGLFVIFLVLVLTGAALSFLLPYRDPDGAGEAVGASKSAEGAARGRKGGAGGVWSDVRETFLMAVHPKVLLMTVAIWHTGFKLPYQISVFSRVFSEKCSGLEMVVFFSAEVLMGVIGGRLLDWEALGGQRRRAIYTVGLFVFLSIVSLALGYIVEDPYAHSVMADGTGGWVDGAPAREFFEAGNLLPTAVYFLYGLADSILQVYVMWLLGTFFKGDRLASAVGYYKFVQSAGWSIGFALTPLQRLAPLSQFYTTVASFVLSAVLLVGALPPPEGADAATREAAPLIDGSAA